MWDLSVSVPEHCLSFYFTPLPKYLVKGYWNQDNIFEHPLVFKDHTNAAEYRSGWKL